MQTIFDIDFAALYRSHLCLACRKPKQPQDWDKKAEQMQASQLDLHTDYVQAFTAKVACAPTDSVLDIGCGGGAIGLALAPQVAQVYALDYSPKMLELVRERARLLALDNVTPLLKSWDEDWAEVPEVDICIASRSTMVNDLADALAKINAKARKAAYLTLTVDKDFIAQDILRAIGRDSVGFPSYIYAVNLLAQQGYRPNVSFIEHQGCLTPTPPAYTEQAFIQTVQWSIGALNVEETDKLKHYFAKNSQNLTAYPARKSWALVSWQQK